MSIDPKTEKEYKKKGFPTLPDKSEDATLKSRHQGRIRMSLKATGEDMATKFMMALIQDKDLTLAYRVSGVF